MGITGLLPAVSSIIYDKHIDSMGLRGKKVAIDMHCWLHKSSYSCAQELVQNIPTDKYIKYCIKRFQMLLSYGILPVAIFDGAPLPMKHSTTISRKIKREQNKQKALQYLKEGNITQARECFQQAVAITPKMVLEVIKVVQEMGIEYYVAPYEADAQLTYLSNINYIECIITEDSDLIPYGCKRLFYKMDDFGNGKEFKFEDLGSTGRDKKNLNFVNFTLDMIRQTCILSGCDYLDSIPGLGLKKAHLLIRQYKDISKVIQYLKGNQNPYYVPEGYEKDFWRAEMTFLYQRVFDPISKSLVFLNQIPKEIEEIDLNFLGPDLDPKVAIKISLGEIDPLTKESLINNNNFKNINYNFEKKEILSSGNYFNPTNLTKSLDIPIQKNNLLKYYSKDDTNIQVSVKAQKPFLPPRKSPLIESERGRTLKKKKIENSTILVERSPSPEGNIEIVSKYFKDPNLNSVRNSLNSSVFQTKNSYSSPTIQRITLPSIRISQQTKNTKSLDDDYIVEEIKSDEEIIPESDPEDEF